MGWGKQCGPVSVQPHQCFLPMKHPSFLQSREYKGKKHVNNSAREHGVLQGILCCHFCFMLYFSLSTC